MSKLDKQELLAKEKQLRRELNEASDEVEQQIVRAAGIALVSGLVAWGVYKLFAPSSDDEKPEKKNTSSSGFNYAWLGRILKALIPLIISQVLAPGSTEPENVSEEVSE